MPTIVTHGLSSLLLGKSILKRKTPWRLWFWSAICSMLPDADVVGFLFGVRYNDFWGHRGFTHSISFALLCAVGIVFIFNKQLSKIRVGHAFWFMYFSLIITSHGFFDAFTDGGLGVAFFSPFDNARYFFPWTPVMVSPIGVHGIFSSRGVHLFLSEFKFILMPLVLIYLLSAVVIRLNSNKKARASKFESDQSKSKIYWLFLKLSVPVGLLFAALWSQLPQHDSAGYFNFSDTRIILGIPHFGDVVSNLSFVAAGLIGLKIILSKHFYKLRFIKALFWMFSLGLVAVGMGSAYFHLNPTPVTLFWDRLPMAWCFATILTLVLVDRTNSASAVPLFLLILVLSLLSVIVIDVGLNDLRPYIVVQFGLMLMLLLLLMFYKGNMIPNNILLLMLSFYGLAKVFEIYDMKIHQQLIFISGHSLKHIAAAIASAFLFLGIKEELKKE